MKYFYTCDSTVKCLVLLPELPPERSGSTSPSLTQVSPWLRMYFSISVTVHFWLRWLLPSVSSCVTPCNIIVIDIRKLRYVIYVNITDPIKYIFGHCYIVLSYFLFKSSKSILKNILYTFNVMINLNEHYETINETHNIHTFVTNFSKKIMPSCSLKNVKYWMCIQKYGEYFWNIWLICLKI